MIRASAQTALAEESAGSPVSTLPVRTMRALGVEQFVFTQRDVELPYVAGAE